MTQTGNLPHRSVLAGVAAAPFAARAAEPIRIGLLIAKTGQITGQTEYSANGAFLAREERGNQIMGQPAELTWLDEPTPQAATQNMQKLVQEIKVCAVFAQGNRVKDYVTGGLDADSIRFLLISSKETQHGQHADRMRRSPRDRRLPELFQGPPRPQAARQGVLSAGRDPYSLPARGARRGGYHRRDSHLLHEKAGPAAPLPFHDVTPTHDHLGDVLGVLDAGQFQSCFAAWVASITGIPEGVIAIDGKTSRRSGLKSKGKAAIHMVYAFAARQRLVLGQAKVTEKSNEIIAIWKLLDLLTVEGAIVWQSGSS